MLEPLPAWGGLLQSGAEGSWVQLWGPLFPHQFDVCFASPALGFFAGLGVPCTGLMGTLH